MALKEKEYISEYMKQYYRENREKHLAAVRKWQKENKEKVRAAKKKHKQTAARKAYRHTKTTKFIK